MEPRFGNIEKAIVPPLVTALAEVCEQRPADPIEYIAQSLHKFKEKEIQNLQTYSEYKDRNSNPQTTIPKKQDDMMESEFIDTDMAVQDSYKSSGHVHTDFAKNFGDLYDDDDF